MDVKSAAQIIRDTVDIETIVNLYGYQVRHGFMICPFHGDKDPSLKIYAGASKQHSGWHCFGCGRGGSVIDFVKEHENCDFKTAVRAIDHALRLGLFASNENPFDLERERRVQKWLDRLVDGINEYCEGLIDIIETHQKISLIRLHALEEKRDHDIRSVTAKEWDFLLSWKYNDEYDEYRKEKIKEYMEEVAAWRRKKRAEKAR